MKARPSTVEVHNVPRATGQVISLETLKTGEPGKVPGQGHPHSWEAPQALASVGKPHLHLLWTEVWAPHILSNG